MNYAPDAYIIPTMIGLFQALMAASAIFFFVCALPERKTAKAA